jgi:hypothetical protein
MYKDQRMPKTVPGQCDAKVFHLQKDSEVSALEVVACFRPLRSELELVTARNDEVLNVDITPTEA